MENYLLNELYASKWDTFSKKLDGIVKDEQFKVKPTNPLLLKLSKPEIFREADIRIMIFGQETNDWGGEFNNDFSWIFSIYEIFLQTGNAFPHRGVFRNHINWFIRKTRQEAPKQNVQFVWNNLIKVGKANQKNRPPNYIYEIEKNHFKVLRDEVDILKPNLILFMTGIHYDEILDFQFPNVTRESVDGFSQNLFQKLHIPGVENAYRIPHPNYLNRKGKALYESVYNKIISEISI